MDQIIQIFQSVMSIGEHLGDLGNWAYAILVLIVFSETGLVILPFLPGDTLLFTAGAYTATGNLSLVLLDALIILAAVFGNTVNFWVGSYLVKKLDVTQIKWIDQTALKKTHGFFEKHGGKTIILARFIPVIRTFAPFVAGISHMNFVRFQIFNVVGAILWVVSLTLAGYFFGNIPIIYNNLSLIVILGVLIAVVPLAIGGLFKLIQPFFKNKIQE
ncbi:MAG: VTT domain-containing protein [Betaproteobacteria bacterium]